MRLRLFAVIPALVLALAASAALAADFANGVCGYPWNVRTHELKGFSHHSSTELFTFHAAPEGIEILPDAAAAEALFGFTKAGLFAVYVRPQDTSAYNTAMDAMLEEFGNPVTSRRQGVTFYIWQQGDLKIKFVRDMNKNTRAMAFYNLGATQPEHKQTMEEHADAASGLIPPSSAGKNRRKGMLEF